ncbi:hypothetical protein F4820DRAFT_440802 [Hypoxylon rubiginosum]|uniref:Uncharacterized protein n=1 Tax=Hypoxylon rubiginosum TaxID=110542 RepID=A0ACB9YIR4_9PEZI|nr:hypothetical protein F4820DRAFT_440802 [Hypoxylon rubiginosum]
MSRSQLKYVRHDSKHVVMTEHPDFIHPQVLADELTNKYGDQKVKISLRRNIYLVYIDIEVADKEFLNHKQDPESNVEKKDTNDIYYQKLEDTRLAEKVLKEARLSSC